MNLNKLSSRLRAASGAMAFLVLASISCAQTVDNKPDVKQEVMDRVTKLITTAAYVPGIDFSKWPAFLETEKPKLDAAKDDEEFARAMNEALTKFGASHVAFATPRASEARRTGAVVGIGITSQQTPDGIIVVRTVPGASAAEAGLIPGDLITQVDGKKVEGIKGIPGPEGTSVTITVKHKDGKVQDYKLVRKKFSTVRPEELTEIDKDTAKLSIYTFDISYDPDNVENLMKKAGKYKNLILDLRDNGGGAVLNLQHLLGLFVPSDEAVGVFVSKRSVNKYVEETHGSATDLQAIAKYSTDKIRPRHNYNAPRYTGKVVVLVNQFSGSASEICAAGMRDTIGAQVVGTKSAGAVLVSVMVPASHGFLFQYPLADYVTINGQRLEGSGVTPDILAKEARLRLPGDPDEAVMKAQELLKHL